MNDATPKRTVMETFRRGEDDSIPKPPPEALRRIRDDIDRNGGEMAPDPEMAGAIGATVQAYAESQGYSVVRNYVGHGIGRAMHEEPQVPNYGLPDRGLPIKSGLCLAIEPMLNAGTADTRVLGDQWTVVTEDGSLSAHFEHTIWCTDEGPVVLTAAGGGADARLRAELEAGKLVQA